MAPCLKCPLGLKHALVNILATDPVSFPIPTVKNTCFLPPIFRAGARVCGEEFVSILTKVGAKR